MASSRKQINVETDAGGINVCVNSVKRDRRDSKQRRSDKDESDHRSAGCQSTGSDEVYFLPEDVV